MGPYTILFVEDDWEFLEIRKEWLEDEKFSILSANNPNEALNILAGSEYIDLSIVDIRLVDNDKQFDISGLQLAIETMRRSIPTVILSNYSEYAYVREIKEWYPDAEAAFIAKHEEKDIFIELVKKHIRKRSVFIVHGHDLNMRNDVELFVRQLDLQPIILADQQIKTATIFQQLIHYSNVAYVIVLLTPDDTGGKNPNNLKPRARQNVIFELGYFIGKYGTRKVRVLIPENLEKPIEEPSDFHGVLYIPYNINDNKWKISLVSELKNTGIDVTYP